MPFSSSFLSFIFTSLCVFQRELSNAADTTARLYWENTPESRRSATEIWVTMTKAQEKLIKRIRTRNFEKFISVAHKDNGDDFFYEVRIRFVLLLAFNFIFHPFSFHLFLHSHMLQIDSHFSTFMYPDMTIEKLQKVATTHVDASFKAKWLRWWNSPAKVKMENQFPSSVPLREKILDDWLNRASFWAQVHLHHVCLLVC
jgi:hypothetical protein